MTTLREKFIQQMLLKGYSQRTIRTYVSLLSGISRHFQCSPDLITINQIRDYLQENITVVKRSKSWVNQVISAIKFLYCEVLQREWSYLDIPRPRCDKKLPVVLSRAEVEKILSAHKNLKHKAILMTTYSAGLRLSEVCHLVPGDIDSSRMLIRVNHSKGNKDRFTLLSPLTLNILRTYYKKYRPVTWLFEGALKSTPISVGTVNKVFKNALVKAEVNRQVGIHSLRHSFATHLLEQGVALPVIQQILGHKSLKTTSGYLHVQQYSIQNIKSPVDTLTV
ncbi:MAG TPA: site-specific integrase [Bacteroidales bacterium]|nr:site-specific integrase [Bacteroidales bacterium]